MKMIRKVFVFLFLLNLFLTGRLVAQGNSLLWKVSGKNLNHTSYLYGTMHSGDPRVFHLADSVFPALEMCDGFAMEVLVDEQTQSTMLQNVFMKNEEKLSNLLTPSQLDSLQLFSYKYTGLNIEYFEKMKPLYVAMMLEVLSNADTISNESKIFLDQFLQQSATKMEKQIFGLETVEEQMGIFDVLPYVEQADLLMKTIRGYSNDTSDYEEMIGYYLNNDLHSMMNFENDFSLPDSLYNALITNRNIRMADRIDTMIHRRSMFIAVGAGHLGSSGGLVELLRNKGFTVLPVLPVYSNYLKDGWYQFQSFKNHFSISFPSKPEVSIYNFSSDRVSAYECSLKEPLTSEENFAVYVFSESISDSDIENFLSTKNFTSIILNHNSEEKYFSFTVGEKQKGKGVMIYSGSKRYVIVYFAQRKTKNINRFTASFQL